MISVLYVDDESDLLDIGKQFLEKTGMFTVDTAESTGLAFEKIQEKAYDAIVCDYQMPEMNGIEFLKSLRASGNFTPFIFFTGKGREEVVIQAFDNGADFYIQKGGDPKAQFAELAHKVKQAVELRRADNARRESEMKLASIIDFLPDATFAIDAEGRVIAWNRAIEAMTGVRAVDILGKGDHEYAIPFYGERRPILIDLALIPDEEALSEYSFVKWEEGRLVAETVNARPRGREVVLWEMATPLYDSQGRLTGAIESIRDITRQKQEEEVLRKTRDLLKQSQHAANTGSWDWDIATGILTWSEEFFVLFCLDPTVYPSFETWLAILHPDDRKNALPEINRSIQEKKQYNREYRIIVPDGTIRWIGALGNATYDENGQPLRMSGICIDITDRKQTEEELAVAKEKYTKAFLSAPDAITISDLESGRFLEVNDAASTIFGYSRDELIGKSALELGIWIDSADRDALVRQVRGRGGVTHYEVTERRKSGEQFHASVNADTMTIGGTRYLVAITRDITDRIRTEQTLRESEARYCALFNNNYFVFLLIDPDTGRIVDANEAASRYYGHPRERLTSAGIYDLNQLPKAKVVKNLLRAKNEHEKHFFSTHYLASGEMRNVEVYSGPITIQGKPLLYSIIHDITEQKEIEKALRESENRYRNVIEDQTEFVCRFLPNGTHVFVNEAYCRIFNKTRNEIIGHVFIPDIPEEDRKIVRQHFLSLTPENPVAIIAHRIILSDGSIHWQRWSDRAIFDKNGKIVEYQSVGRDITEQKQVEAALRDSEQLRLEIIDHLPDPTLAIDEHGTVIAWNKAIEEFLGIKARDMVGKGNYEYAIPFYGERRPILIDLVTHPDEEFLTRLYDGISRVGETLVAETTIARPLGKTKVLWAKVSPLYDKSGRPTGAIETIRDITERKREEMKIRHVNRQLNLLSSITRHDILNQLLVLKGYLQISRDVLDNPEILSGFLEREEDAARTIEELILFTKEYHNLGIKAPEWQGVNTSIYHAESSLPLRDVAVVTDCSTLEVLADPLFKRVFYNLVDNALRYGGDRMTMIRFFSQESDDGLIIVCEDDGAGVPADKKEAIFSRGYYKHTGFGLYLSREILRITGISIIENSESGKGARFEIRVPNGVYRWNKESEPGEVGPR